MNAPAPSPFEGLRDPVDMASRHVAEHRALYYRWLREEAPVHRGRISVIPVWMLSRFEDCWNLLRDDRFVRDRRTATGKGRSPVPVPPTVRHLMESMIVADEPEHTRLRSLVQKAFTTSAIARLEGPIRESAHALLDTALGEGRVDLQQAYALPIPVRVISEMMGVSDEEAPRFRDGLRVLSEGLSGWSMVRTMLWDLPKLDRFVRGLIARKRTEPGDDVLSALIAAEEAGDRLSEDELVSMTFLLVIAGFETTVHLITNLVFELLRHPAELERLRADPALLDGAVEEGLRYCGPIHGTKPHYPLEDVELHGVRIPRGATVIPVLGAANRDPAMFDDPETFDVGRTPTRHLGFGRGIHYCLGAQLARMETRIALGVLLERCPDLSLAVPEADVRPAPMPFWHRYDALPVRLA